MITIHFNRNKESGKLFADLCVDWWAGHYDGGLMDHYMMTDFGVMALNKKNEPVAAGFLFPPMGSKMCIFGFQVTNPKASKRDVVNGIKCVATEVHRFAKELGYEGIVCYPRPNSLKKILASMNYIALDENVTQFVRGL